MASNPQNITSDLDKKYQDYMSDCKTFGKILAIELRTGGFKEAESELDKVNKTIAVMQA